MSIHFYRDLNGYVGEPREEEPELTPREEADDAARIAFCDAEALAAILDRHAGDSGENAAAIYSIAGRIADLTEEVRVLLGEPRVMRNGSLVPVGSVGR